MEKLKSAWLKLKAKYWDDTPASDTSTDIPNLFFERSWIRRFWENHKLEIIKGSRWLVALIAGALIISWLGL